MAKAASVFVLYATSCANNVALKSNRKTLHGADVVTAMKDMEFHKFVRPLESALDGWRAGQARKKEEQTARKKQKESSDAGRRDGGDDDEVKVVGEVAAPAAAGDKENSSEDKMEVAE